MYGLLANVVGMFVTLLFGAAQLTYVLDIPWSKAMIVGVYPFVIVGVIKAVIASYIGIKVRNRLIVAKLLDDRHVSRKRKEISFDETEPRDVE